MAEPNSSAVGVTLAVSGAAVPVLSAFGVPLGISPDVLIAGFAGSLAAMVLLNSVPSRGTGVAAVVVTTLRRVMVAIVSSLMAAYLARPIAVDMSLSTGWSLLLAFAVGAGAQPILEGVVVAARGAVQRAIDRVSKP